MGTALPQDSAATIQRLYQEAAVEEKAGRLDKAVEKYEIITRLDPGLAPAYNNLGRLYFEQNRMEEAIKTLQHALTLDAKLGPAHAVLGLSYFEIGDYRKARQELQTALTLIPGDENAGLYLARSLYQLNDYEGALQILTKLHRRDPKNPNVLYNAGLAHMKLAEADLLELQNVAPDSALVEVLLGNFAESKQVYAEAVEHYRKALAKSPNSSGLHYSVAHALWAGGNFQEALPEYQRAVELNPYDWNSYWEMARIILPDNPEEAYKLSSRALQLKPDILEALLIRGRALIGLKKPEQAIEDLKKARALDQEDPAVHFQLARAYRELGQTQEAEAETAIYGRLQEEAHTPQGDQKAPSQ
jgi:tetratricopeptide (TPR) repeat protein